MDIYKEIAQIEEEILIGEMSDDLFYVNGKGRTLRNKLKQAKSRLYHHNS